MSHQIGFMSEHSTTIELLGPDDQSHEQMVFLEDTRFVPADMVVGGKLIIPSDIAALNQLDELLVILPGLRGFRFGLRVDRKARSLVTRNDAACGVLRLIPEGINRQYKLGIGRREKDTCIGEVPQFFNQQFSFERFLMYFTAAVQTINNKVGVGCKVHVAGHSYGALSLLYALRMFAQDGTAMPNSAHFLAPFVKAAFDTQDPAIACSVVNTRVQVDMALHDLNMRQELQYFLRDAAKYLVCDGEVDLLEQHQRVFTTGVYEEIGNLANVVKSPKNPCQVQIIRGDRDSYIDDDHAELIASRTGLIREEIEHTIPGGHGLRNLDLEMLMPSQAV